MSNSEKEVYSYLRRAIRDEISSLGELYQDQEIEPLIARAERADQEDLVFYTRAAGSILIRIRDSIWKEFCREIELFDGFLQKVLEETEKSG